MNRYFSWSYLAQIGLLLASVGSLPLFGQYVDPKVYKVRMDSFRNIESMIVGKEVTTEPNLAAIASPIKKGPNLALAYEAFLESKRQEIFEKIEKESGVSFVDVENKRKADDTNCGAQLACSPTKKKVRTSARIASMQAPSAALLARARDTLKFFENEKMPPVEIVKYFKDDYGVASTDEEKIYLCEEELKKYDSESHGFILIHELMHVLKKHSSEGEILKDLLKEKHGRLSPLLRKYLLELERCNEAIADIEGVLRGGKAFINGYKKFILRLRQDDLPQETLLNANVTRGTHPSYSHRIRQAELLEQELSLLEEKEQKVGYE